MTCNEAQELLGPFVDAELPSSMLLAVARHAAVCPACDGAIRELTDLHEAVAGAVEAAADGLDLSGVWRRVDAAATWHDTRAHRRRRLRALPVWGSVTALAASVLVWFAVGGTPRPDAVRLGGDAIRPAATQIAAKMPRPTRARVHTEIDRLAGRVASFGREPKSGTPIIWVNYTAGADR